MPTGPRRRLRNPFTALTVVVASPRGRCFGEFASQPGGGSGGAARTPGSLQRQQHPVLGLRPRPEDAPLVRGDRHVVDAGLAAAHVALLVELPLLVAVGAPPLAVGVERLVLEAHRDPVARERPQVLAQRVLALALPLARQERGDRLTALQELVAVAPLRVLRVGGGDARGIAGVPGVFGGLDLLAGDLFGEGRKRRSYGSQKSLRKKR